MNEGRRDLAGCRCSHGAGRLMFTLHPVGEHGVQRQCAVRCWGWQGHAGWPPAMEAGSGGGEGWPDFEPLWALGRFSRQRLPGSPAFMSRRQADTKAQT